MTKFEPGEWWKDFLWVNIAAIPWLEAVVLKPPERVAGTVV